MLVEARTPMNLAVLAPVVRELQRDPRLVLRFTGPPREDLARAFDEIGAAAQIVTRERAAWMRVDLYINADPWDAVTLHRAGRQINFFHGVAGKYDLDCPRNLPIDFKRYDMVAFPNQDRLTRYVEAGIVAPARAALVGFPKADALAERRLSREAAAAVLGFDGSSPTIIYAPTFSPASSLHSAGEAIIEALLGGGWNVIAKLHDRSLDPDPKYTGGIDWRARLARFTSTGRFLLAARGDSTPYVLASSLMVTDHSSIGFEFFVLDRPVVVFDAPRLPAAARINPEKIALLRSAARRRAANAVFHEPGGATRRALALVYELLDLAPARKSQPAATAVGAPV